MIIIGTLGQAISGTIGQPILIASNNQTIVNGAHLTMDAGFKGTPSITNDGHGMSIFGVLIFWRFVVSFNLSREAT